MSDLSSILPGPVILFGSGETSPDGRKIWNEVFKQLTESPRVALLETPAGFELNSSQVIGRVGEFIDQRLQNFRPSISIVRARRRGTALSPDDPGIVSPILDADLIFMGPGSPSYAVRQLKGSLAWYNLIARHRLGASLVLASAATIAVSAFSLPVYEIYKAGEDLHWKEGLDFFGMYGLPLVFVPHWNNRDGGEDLDTSRCFMGQERFAELMKILPADLTVIGIDEKTALILDIVTGAGKVLGKGGVTVIHTGEMIPTRAAHPDLQTSGLGIIAKLRRGHVHFYSKGETFSLSECCPFFIPELGMGLTPEIWRKALAAHLDLKGSTEKSDEPTPLPPEEVLELVEIRQAARQNKDWKKADELREQIAALNWQVVDSKEGYLLKQKE